MIYTIIKFIIVFQSRDVKRENYKKNPAGELVPGRI
jgi:hypothetical protein